MKLFLIGACAALLAIAPAAAQFTGGVKVATGDYNGDSAELETDGLVDPNTIRSAGGRAEAGGKAFELSEFSLKAEGGDSAEHYAEITLKKGYIATDDAWTWDVGDVIPKLTLTGADNRGRAMKVELINAQITNIKYATGGDSAKGAMAIEKIELCVEKVERVLR